MLGLACFFVFSVFVKVKLSVPLLCFCVHYAWKGCLRNDLYCVGWDVRPYTLTHSHRHPDRWLLKCDISDFNALYNDSCRKVF